VTTTATRPAPGPSGAAPSSTSRGARPPLALAVAAVVVAGLCVLPLVVVVAKALESGPAAAFELLWRPRVAELLRNTVSLVVVTGLLSTVLGVGAAWLVGLALLLLAGGAMATAMLLVRIGSRLWTLTAHHPVTA